MQRRPCIELCPSVPNDSRGCRIGERGQLSRSVHQFGFGHNKGRHGDNGCRLSFSQTGAGDPAAEHRAQGRCLRCALIRWADRQVPCRRTGHSRSRGADRAVPGKEHRRDGYTRKFLGITGVLVSGPARERRRWMICDRVRSTLSRCSSRQASPWWESRSVSTGRSRTRPA
jgi:hypothetical protein